MAGIYIHVPFCVSRCGYCDFFKTTTFEKKGRYVEAILNEIELQKEYLLNEEILTVYFGGGTPSTLSLNQFKLIFLKLRSTFAISSNAEITIECNPDDISDELLEGLKGFGVNRISLGIQSFNDSVLRFMQRRHNSKQAYNAVTKTQQAGFKNISIDLIYGLPNVSIEEWKCNVKKALELKVQHISAYHLTYEKDTAFDKLLKKGLIDEVDEESSVEQFDFLKSALADAGFSQYEISNFCVDGLYSQHNSNYWKGENYLGLGPSAHSFNGSCRSWNVSNLKNYFNCIENNELPQENEVLSIYDIYNEMMMVGLRTIWGVDLIKLNSIMDESLKAHFDRSVTIHIVLGNLEISNNILLLKADKFMVSDSIISDLFFAQ